MGDGAVGYFAVPFLPSVSEKFNYIMRDIDNVRTFYFSLNKLDKLIKGHKDPLPKALSMNVVYKIDCNDCNASYVGQTGRRLQTRIEEHRKHINRNSSSRSVITDHKVNFGHDFKKWEDVRILDRGFINV